MSQRAIRIGIVVAAVTALALTIPLSTVALLILGSLVGVFLMWWMTPNRDTLAITAVTGRAGERFPARLATVLNALPVPIALIDGRANLVSVNAAAANAFPGLRQGQPLSLGLRDPAILAAVTSCLKGAAMAEAELLERVPVERSFAVTVALLDPLNAARSAAGGREVAILILRDTSEQRRLETMRVDFVANASHELRTPLASISGFIETLQGAAKDDKAAQTRFLGIMGEQARRMARLVDDLLSLSRIELKSHIAPSEAVEIVPVLRQIVDSLSGLAHERGVTISMNDAAASPVWVTGDRDELLRVFDNLVENAIKYGRAGGRVDIVLDATSKDDATIRVRDYGPGIPEKHLPRLTERFYRVDTGMSKAEGGTGLGLAIVKHIVTRHRGRLSITSTLGSGATFAVTLPRHPDPVA